MAGVEFGELSGRYITGLLEPSTSGISLAGQGRAGQAASLRGISAPPLSYGQSTTR
jgi:hypothetical protein